MGLYIKRTLDDGATIVGDTEDGGFEQSLKPGQWEEVGALPVEDQRARMAELLDENKAEGGRSALDEQAIETAANAATGEAHEQAEEAR